MSQALKIIVGVVVVLVIAAGSFYGGMIYGKSQATTARTITFPNGQQAPLNGPPGDGQGFRGQGQNDLPGGFGDQAGMTFGTIESIDGSVVTISSGDGAQQTVKVTDTTLIEKNASVSVSDLAAGDSVIVSGSDNTDGSITARSVQVAPAGRMFGGAPGGAPGAAPDATPSSQ
jgi:hypothetical protein